MLIGVCRALKLAILLQIVNEKCCLLLFGESLILEPIPSKFLSVFASVIIQNGQNVDQIRHIIMSPDNRAFSDVLKYFNIKGTLDEQYLRLIIDLNYTLTTCTSYPLKFWLISHHILYISLKSVYNFFPCICR